MRCTLFWALIHTEAKDVVLKGADNEEALRFSYHKIASPSLMPLASEPGTFKQGRYDQTFKFDNLSANEIKTILLNTRKELTK